MLAASATSKRTTFQRKLPMTGKKAVLARVMNTVGVGRVLGRVRNLIRHDVRILAYHRIWDLDNEDSFLYDAELVSASTSDFAWQLEYIRENFSPITCAHLLRAIDGTCTLPARPVILTFDDGYEDNYEYAYPLLQAYDVPATMFLSTSYIGGDKTYWFDRLQYLLLTTPRQSFAPVPDAEPWLLGQCLKSRRTIYLQLLRMLKRVPNALRLEVLQRLEIELQGESCPQSTPDSRPMSWSNAREMSAHDIEFGSHSVTHPILANLSDDELRSELVDSKETLERELHRPIETIAYPVGGQTAYDGRVQAAVKAAGYRLGLSYRPGINPLAKLDHFGLRRMAVERYLDRSYFAAMLQVPELFC